MIDSHDYKQVILDQIKHSVSAHVSEELVHVHPIYAIEELSSVLTAEVELLLWGKQIDSGSKTKNVKTPATWFSMLLETTWLGRCLKKVGFKPKFKTHVLHVDWKADLVFPDWVPTLPTEMMNHTLVVTHRHNEWSWE